MIGAIVAIFGIGAALGLGYPAAAKSAKGHHAQCAKAAKSKAKQAKRRAKCKKPKRTAHGHTRVAQKVGRPASATTPPADSAPAVTAPTTTPSPTTPPAATTPTATPPTTTTPTTTTPAPPGRGPAGVEEAPSATLIIHVWVIPPGPAQIFERHPELGPPCNPCAVVEDEKRIKRIGLYSSPVIETREDTVHVAPGAYEIWVAPLAPDEQSTKSVEVSAGQELEVTFEFAAE